MKELFIKEVTTKMADFLDDNQRIKLRQILIEICLNYEIEIKEQAKCKETQKNNFKLVVSSLQTNNSLYDINFDKKVIIIGNEANGVEPQIQKMADEKIKIPMLGKTESLKASVATGIILYEYVRQKITK